MILLNVHNYYFYLKDCNKCHQSSHINSKMAKIDLLYYLMCFLWLSVASFYIIEPYLHKERVTVKHVMDFNVRKITKQEKVEYPYREEKMAMRIYKKVWKELDEYERNKFKSMEKNETQCNVNRDLPKDEQASANKEIKNRNKQNLNEVYLNEECTPEVSLEEAKKLNLPIDNPDRENIPSDMIKFKKEWWREGNPHDYEYIINNPTLCSRMNVKILFAVTSTVSNTEERMRVRNTWGSIKSVRGVNIAVMFFIARTDEIKLQEKLEKESKIYNDIIQESFEDNYRNLTLKSVMILKWMVNYCNRSQVVLKTDIDVYINTIKVVEVLKQHDFLVGDKVLCASLRRKGEGRLIMRKKGNKWRTKYTEYPHQCFPEFCGGIAYAMSTKMAEKLYKTSLNTKLLWLEDVYVMGILPLMADLELERLRYPCRSTKDYKKFMESLNEYICYEVNSPESDVSKVYSETFAKLERQV